MGKFLVLVFLAASHMPLEAVMHFNTGPEVYVMDRWREGGTWQSGRMDGLRTVLERQPLYQGVYFGIEYFYASGGLRGETASGRALKSTIEDQIIEGRIGFTLRNFLPRPTFITPFGGYGRFVEKNHFLPPSPFAITFEDSFNYFVGGFLSGVNFTPLLSMGINFKVRFMLDGKSQVMNDPVFDNVTLLMQNEINCRLDIPLTYNFYTPVYGLAIRFTPFYEYRHFGGREGFPFNFIDTKFHLYGARLALTYGF